jgi:NADPH:quinone reductase-like Zn-dependent oxidoreductase
MKALVTAPQSPDSIELRDVENPVPQRNEALVAVKAVSINRGECRRLMAEQDGWRPGWDLAGVVLQPAADGSGPGAGARVVGMARSGAWAEQVAVPTSLLAELPSEVSFEQAATLPVAGLTAIRSLAIGGNLLGRKVLVTGASGGVGVFAVQLAKLAGAHVSAVVSRPERAQGLKELGADAIVIGHDTRPDKYDLILESVGGPSLTASLKSLERSGIVVLYGTTENPEVSFDARTFYSNSSVLYGLYVFNEVERHQSGVRDLASLIQFVAQKRLKVEIDLEASWTEAGRAIRALLDRKITGKAVLRVA